MQDVIDVGGSVNFQKTSLVRGIMLKPLGNR